MKRDWTKPQMRLSVASYCNDFLSFLLFLRLALVTALCLLGPLLISKAFGPRIGVAAGFAAFPLWWWHFGLPRFKERGSGFFSTGFCLYGYFAMSAAFVVITLMSFGILEEGKPHPLPNWIPRSRVFWFVIVFTSLFLFDFFGGRQRQNRSKPARLFLGLAVALLLAFWVTKRPPRHSFFTTAPASLTLQTLGNATNYLKLDHDHNWKAFCVSNGTSKTLFYTVTEVEYRTSNGWRSAGNSLSNTLTSTSLMIHRETPGEISPGKTDIFYATIPTSNIPWRLRVGCFEANWQQPVDATVEKLKASLQGVPPPNSKSWSGARYELISEPIAPE